MDVFGGKNMNIVRQVYFDNSELVLYMCRPNQFETAFAIIWAEIFWKVKAKLKAITLPEICSMLFTDLVAYLSHI